MPRYDFTCLKCKEITEIEREIDNREEPPKSCAFCRGRKFVRKWTPVNFRFEV